MRRVRRHACKHWSAAPLVGHQPSRPRRSSRCRRRLLTAFTLPVELFIAFIGPLVPFMAFLEPFGHLTDPIVHFPVEREDREVVFIALIGPSGLFIELAFRAPSQPCSQEMPRTQWIFEVSSQQKHFSDLQVR
eukprot:s3555_g11.t1